ncbi:MAG: exported protein of unknown function [Candidatus Saccharibacteria bacterium]|nr:exported protein of unknown function [Candidatus Saccharibacteria bacterium]
MKKNTGFTIVELLIVIVVIGILAAITIVAYNGVQNKARTTQYQTDVTSLVRKTEAYAAASTSGGYPLTAAGTDLASVTAQTTAGANLTTLVNSLTESKLPPNLTFFAVIPINGTLPSYAQTITAVNASATTDSYFVAYCTTGKGMRIYYPDQVTSTVKTSDVGICP